jgi:hypothetical protein
LNFSFQGGVSQNDCLQKTTVEDLDDLKTRINVEIKIIKKETLRDVFLETVKRLIFFY